MASNTSHYSLVKPAYTDAADIAVINGNMDTIDTQLYNANNGLSKYNTGTAITSGTNFNNLTTPGVYTVETAAIATACTNCPAPYNGQLKVEPSAIPGTGRVIQTYKCRYSNDGHEEYTRMLLSSGWTTWQSETYLILHGTEIAANTDLNSLTTPGNYWSPNSTRSATLSHTPVANAGFTLTVLKKDTYSNAEQRLQSSGNIYTRGSTGSTFGEWNEIALKANITNIPTFKSFQISANSSITLTLTGRCVITAIGDNNGRNMYICRVGGGALAIDELGTSSKVSTSISGTNLTLTSTESTVVFLYATIYSGDVSVST